MSREKSARGPYKKRATPTSSRFKGVTRYRGKWQASVWLGGRYVYLGQHLDERDAARAYDEAITDHYGKGVLTNAALGLYQKEQTDGLSIS